MIQFIREKKVVGLGLILIVGIAAVWFLSQVMEARIGEPPASDSRKPLAEEIAAISAIKAKFMQREWKGRGGEILYPCSNVGAVQFDFRKKAGDTLLDEQGGGWISVMIDTTAHGGSMQWAVKNLYLSYRNTDALVGSKPVVDFSLGLDGQTCIDNLKAAVLLSDNPIETELVPLHLFSEKVIQTPYLVGGRFEGGSNLSDIPLTIGPWIGAAVLADRTTRISTAVGDLVEIDEDDMGCAPGSVARSISYLGDTNDFETDDPQDIYDDLVDDMDTDIGGAGTDDGDMLDGKNTYTEDNDLPIESELAYSDTFDPVNGSDWNDLMEQVQDALENGCDVEILIGWNGGGGHAAMVTEVTVHADGSATIHYVDDPNQGDGVAENEEHVINVDATGNFGAGTVDGFLIECVTEGEEGGEVIMLL